MEKTPITMACRSTQSASHRGRYVIYVLIEHHISKGITYRKGRILLAREVICVMYRHMVNSISKNRDRGPKLTSLTRALYTVIPIYIVRESTREIPSMEKLNRKPNLRTRFRAT
jgi:hypothetical protein